MDWLSRDRTDTFRFVECGRVDGAGGQGEFRDIRELGCFEDGGSIKYNDLSSVKVTGELAYFEVPDIAPGNFLRVYSHSEAHGGGVDILHGTFLATTPSSTYRGPVQAGTLSLYSTLQILADRATTYPLVVDAGSVAVDVAASLVLECGLACIAEPSAMVLSGGRVWDTGTSYLEVVNDLCSMAGFDSAEVDGAGNVRLVPYTNPADTAPVLTLRDDVPGCVFAPEVTYEFDAFDVPNEVVAVLSNEEGCQVAVAQNTDALSPYSIPSRGRTVSHVEEVSEVEDADALQALAERVLVEKSSAVESVEVTHVFVPFDTGQQVRLVYAEAALGFTGTAVSKEVELSQWMTTRTRLRRFVRRL